MNFLINYESIRVKSAASHSLFVFSIFELPALNKRDSRLKRGKNRVE